MDSEEYAAAFIVYYILSDETKTAPSSRKKRKVCVKPWLSRRNELGFYYTIMQEFCSEDIDEYPRFLRMSPALFDEILCLIENNVTKEYTAFCDPIPAKIKLAATLKFLASGMNFAELQHLFCVHKSTLSQFIHEVCEAIYIRLKDKYMKVCKLYFFFNNK